MSRDVINNFENKEETEGAGVKVRRSVGADELRNFDPFLLLDEAFIKAPAGFPDHPHRGFEAVSYILSGSVIHEDSRGHKGIINAGDLQWMTAGRGICHNEKPYGEDVMHGIQLWVNLSKENKMVEPVYQDLRDAEIPRKTENGVTVKVIAGESMGLKSAVFTRTPTMYLHFKLDQGAFFTQPIHEHWNALIFILEGEGLFGSLTKLVKSTAHHTLILGKGDSVHFKNDNAAQLQFLLIAGLPLNEPIARRGPFVMNTVEELEQAYDDYQNGKNGFDHVVEWRSKRVQKNSA